MKPNVEAYRKLLYFASTWLVCSLLVGCGWVKKAQSTAASTSTAEALNTANVSSTFRLTNPLYVPGDTVEFSLPELQNSSSFGTGWMVSADTTTLIHYDTVRKTITVVTPPSKVDVGEVSSHIGYTSGAKAATKADAQAKAKSKRSFNWMLFFGLICISAGVIILITFLLRWTNIIT